MKKVFLALLFVSAILGLQSCSSDDDPKDNYKLDLTIGGKLLGTVTDVYHLYLEYSLETPQGKENKTIDITSGYNNLELKNLPAPCSLTYRLYLNKLDGKQADIYENYNMDMNTSKIYSLYNNGEQISHRSVPDFVRYQSLLGYDMEQTLNGVNKVHGKKQKITLSADGHVAELLAEQD